MRQISEIGLLLTSKCNLRCDRCISGINGKGKHMPDEVLDKALGIIKKTPGIKTVRLSGGEPTLHPRFIEVARRLRAMGKRVVVFTNGQWASTPDSAKQMYEAVWKSERFKEIWQEMMNSREHVDFRISYNPDLVSVQPDTLERIKNAINASGEITNNAIKCVMEFYRNELNKRLNPLSLIVIDLYFSTF